MAKIHVIWDPEDKCVGFNPEVEKKFDIKVAVLPVYGCLVYAEIAQIAEKLAEMLLEQMCHEQ